MNKVALYNLTPEQLRQKHSEIYQEIAPTLKKYTEAATEAVALQLEIYQRGLAEAFPKALRVDGGYILKFSARDMPAVVDGILNELATRQVEVTQIVYDPLRNDFYLFGSKDLVNPNTP